MTRLLRSCRLSLSTLAVGLFLTGSLAIAQTAPATTAVVASETAPPLVPPNGMTIQEYQGLSCMVFATLAAAGVYIYSDVILEVLTGAAVNPVLLIPVMATGFAAGCSVGSTMSPGFLWISNHFK